MGCAAYEIVSIERCADGTRLIRVGHAKASLTTSYFGTDGSLVYRSRTSDAMAGSKCPSGYAWPSDAARPKCERLVVDETLCSGSADATDADAGTP